MIITDKNIEKTLNYIENLDDNKYDTIVDNLLEEQALLSTFIQQNLDDLFNDDNRIKDFTYNIYFTTLSIFKSKNSEKYIIIDTKKLNHILESQNFDHKQEELGDFIFTQYVESEFAKSDFLKVIGLLSVVIKCLDY